LVTGLEAHEIFDQGNRKLNVPIVPPWVWTYLGPFLHRQPT
jgi:hypothetical protein